MGLVSRIPNSLLKNLEPNILTLYDRWAVYVLFDSIRPTHYLKFVNTSLYVSTFLSADVLFEHTQSLSLFVKSGQNKNKK